MFRKCFFSFKVFSPEIQVKFDKITAVAKGFLTRRLLQTEKLKHIKQTVKVRSAFLYCAASSPTGFHSCLQLTDEIMYFLLCKECENVCHLCAHEACFTSCHKVQVKQRMYVLCVVCNDCFVVKDRA